MRLLLLGIGVAIIAGALALTAAGGGRTGRLAPELPARMLAGPPTSLSSLRGRPAVVDFFASWCEPCTGEAPILRRAQRALVGRARLVAVDWSDSRRYALDFVRRFGWHFPVLYDPNGTAGYAYGIQGLPTAFVLNASGRVVQRLVGPQTVSGLERAVASAGP